jgi:hypothetical protein
MRELIVRAALHRAALGDPAGLEAVRPLAETIDSPALRAAIAGPGLVTRLVTRGHGGLQPPITSRGAANATNQRQADRGRLHVRPEDPDH